MYGCYQSRYKRVSNSDTHSTKKWQMLRGDRDSNCSDWITLQCRHIYKYHNILCQLNKP